MAKTKKPTPFDVKMTPEQRTQMAGDLCREVQDALSARAETINPGGLIDLYDWFYEQGRTEDKDRPFPGAADLTSYFITVDVDALRSRLMKAVFGVRPFAFVEGWGADAAKAPFVEAFMDWQVRTSGLKEELGKVIHGALIEDCYILEVSEKIETRRLTETIDAALDVSSGGPVFADGQPQIQMDRFGDPVPAADGQPAAKVERTQTKTRRLGPQYDPISMKDFVFLPGHVKHARQLSGYAYRVWLKVADLLDKAQDGVYDEDVIRQMGDQSDRQMSPIPVTVDSVAPQYDPANIEKECFQLSIQRDLDGDGRPEWYVATIHLPSQTMLRLKLDTFVTRVGIPRCVPFVFFPRRDSVYGYSYAGKEVTLAEEHTAVRNMKADRQALATNVPLTQLSTSQWDPDTQPIGVGSVIKVRDHNEIRQMQIMDVPASVVQSEMMLHQANERVSGLSDAFQGLLSEQARTLGENRLAAGGSAVRVDEVVGYLHASIAKVLQLSLAIIQDQVQADPKGIEAPAGLVDTLKAQGMDLQDNRFTASQLMGKFAFEPYGSDLESNPQQQLTEFNTGVESLVNLAKVFPPLQGMFQNPLLAKTILQGWARAYHVRNVQPFFQAFAQVGATPGAQPPAAPLGSPGVPAPPGLPPPGALPARVDPMLPAAPSAGGAPPLAALLASLTGHPGAPSVQ